MSTRPSEKEVLDHVRWLENMPGEREMRERSRNIHDLAFMQKEANFSEHVGRGKTWSLPLADLLEMAYAIQAERHSYQTSVQLTALDDTPQTTIDRIEKWCAIRVAQHLRRWLVTDEAGFHQLLTYAGMITWHCDDPDGPFMTRIETPDPDTTFFPVKGSGRPSILGQRFRMLLRAVESKFANGLRDGSVPYMTKNGAWSRYKLGDDRPYDSYISSSYSDLAHDCELVRLDANGWVTVLAVNKATGYGTANIYSAGGMILWQEESRACPDEDGNEAAGALVVPGFVSPNRQPRNRLQPMFMPGVQAVNALFDITSILATKGENSTGDVLVNSDPEQIRAASAVGMTGATLDQFEAGNPSIVRVAGNPTIWERLPEPYLMKLLDFWSLRYDRWAASLREISDPALLAQINTNVYLPHAAARRKLMGPMLDQTDAAMKELVRLDVHALQYYGAKKSKAVSTGTERYGASSREMTRGETVEISWADVKDFDKRFILSVSTNSMTEEEQRQRLLAHEEKVQMGYATKRQGISVAGYADEEAQIEELAVDEVYLADTALLRPQLPSTIADAVRLAGGMNIQIEGPVQAPVPNAPATPNNVTYQTPAIPGPQGQSEPAVV